MLRAELGSDGDARLQSRLVQRRDQQRPRGFEPGPRLFGNGRGGRKHDAARIEPLAVLFHAVVGVGAGGESRRSRGADGLPLLDARAGADSFRKARQVKVERFVAVCVPQVNVVALRALPRPRDHRAVCRGMDGRSARGGVVNAVVRTVFLEDGMEAAAAEARAQAPVGNGHFQELPPKRAPLLVVVARAPFRAKEVRFVRFPREREARREHAAQGGRLRDPESVSGGPGRLVEDLKSVTRAEVVIEIDLPLEHLRDARRETAVDVRERVVERALDGARERLHLPFERLDLKRRLDLISRRKAEVPQIFELFQSAQEQLKNDEQDACRTSLQAILKLHPGNAEALRIEQTLQEHHHDQESQLQLEAALAAARNALDQEDFERCLKVTSSALELSPGHPAALALKSKALEGLNLGNLEELLATVRRYVGAQDYESSYQTAAEGLKLHPEHPELLEIRQRAKKAIDQQRQVASLLEKAHRRLDKEKYSQGLKFVEKVLALEPEHPEALELKRSAQEALDPGPAELKELQEDAAENSTAREEYQTHVGKLLEFVKGEIQREDLKSALHNLSFLLELEPDHPEALELKDETEAALSKQGPPPPSTSDQSASEGEDTQVLKDVTLTIEKKTPTTVPPRVPLKAPGFLGKAWLKPLAGGVVVVLLLLAAVTGWPGNRAKTALEPLAGSLILNIVPWANVDSITRIDTVEAILIEQDLTTPCVVPMPPGEYRIQVSNPYFQGSLEFEVHIVAGEPSVIHKTLPTFDLEQALSAAVAPGL